MLDLDVRATLLARADEVIEQTSAQSRISIPA